MTEQDYPYCSFCGKELGRHYVTEHIDLEKRSYHFECTKEPRLTREEIIKRVNADIDYLKETNGVSEK